MELWTEQYQYLQSGSPLRITLVYPSRPGGAGTNLVPPLGVLYLGAVLEESGHIVKLLNFTIEW